MNAYLKALKQSDGRTLIISNAIGTIKTQVNHIARLFESEDFLLDPKFLKYSLYQACPWEPISQNLDNLEPWRNAPMFFGNFRDLSYGFTIITLDKSVEDRLQSAINSNILRNQFIDAADEIYADHSIGLLKGKTVLLEPKVVRSIQTGTDDLQGSSYYLREAKVLRPWSSDIIQEVVKPSIKAA